MNIKQAKEELLSTIQAYLVKDETGEYAIPTERQRPILLMGPPGIGKTAIMEQVAEEAHINLVSYTITHHTRQSAIGLPFIRQREYGGKTYSVTEYTMSEIIASVYEQTRTDHASVPAVQDLRHAPGSGGMGDCHGGQSAAVQQIRARF